MTKSIPTNSIPTKTIPTKTIRAGLLAVATLLTVGAAPAHAAPQESLPGNWLHLTVTQGDLTSSSVHGALLLCDPPGGQHSHAAQACAELRAAGGDISRVPPRADVLCSMIYAPVTAAALGEWDGRRITYKHTFSNSCVMEAETGAVFQLSD
ncbi:SSI family serine proteinase inhibitor [Streptomyces sp. NPDC058475]|uniref:SSI family serine proteinase inhibitor n=1 Tax=Streptomyces sp. NPDC058475 TaxID=3346518 RepID=UPI003659EE45